MNKIDYHSIEDYKSNRLSTINRLKENLLDLARDYDVGLVLEQL